jgi:hypothetical protein
MLASFAYAPLILVLCLFAPGMAWRSRLAPALPRVLGALLISTAVTSALAIGLTSIGLFSVATIGLLNTGITAIGASSARIAPRNAIGAATSAASATGLLMAALFLAAAWPPLETHLVAQDSSAYLALGEHINATGHAWKRDDLSPRLPRATARRMYPSYSYTPGVPPFGRLPGGVVVDRYDADRAWPAFFPLPSLWAAIFSDTLGERLAGGFAPLFAAMGLASFFVVVRSLTGTLAAAMAVGTLAANAAFAWAAWFPLSEPLAFAFLWGGLAALTANEEVGAERQGMLAGWLLASAAVARVELAVFVIGSLAFTAWASRTLRAAPLPAGLLAGTAIGAVVLLVQAVGIPGGYAAPLVLTAKMLQWRVTVLSIVHPLAIAATVAALAILAWSLWRRFGLLGPAVIGGWSALLLTRWSVFDNELSTTMTWLTACGGIALPLIALPGIAAMWGRRAERRVVAPLLALGIGAAAIVMHNPQVLPYLPWGARRLVPVILPALVAAAAVACHQMARRSRLAALLTGVAILWGSVSPTIPMFGQSFFAGGYRQLLELEETIPPDALLAIDKELHWTILGPVLWLRGAVANVATVHPSNMDEGAHELTVLTYTARNHPELGPVYYLRPALRNRTTVAGIRAEMVRQLELTTTLPRPTVDQPAPSAHRSHALLTLEKLTPVWPARPQTPAADKSAR